MYNNHYSDSHALVIGVDEYTALPPLHNAVNDAHAVADLLGGPLRFDSVRLLLDADATRDAILDYMDTELTQTKPDDRVVIFYAGHGTTRNTISQGAVGYLQPYGTGGKYSRSLYMSTLIDYAHHIPANPLHPRLVLQRAGVHPQRHGGCRARALHHRPDDPPFGTGDCRREGRPAGHRWHGRALAVYRGAAGAAERGQ